MATLGTNTIRSLVDHFIRRVPIDQELEVIRAIAAYDRYQASEGIEQAASIVAEFAESTGLASVEVDRFPANGDQAWWSYRSPVSWTPTTAKLCLRAEDEVLLRIDHATSPFSVATYSCPLTRRNLSVSCMDTLHTTGCQSMVLVDSMEFRNPDVIGKLTKAGAFGFITDSATKTVGGQEYVGRIELDSSTSLTGFSVTHEQFSLLAGTIGQSLKADVDVQIARTAQMPVVSAVIPGESSKGEVWFTGHLCHPRPGANDNASGVAALLGVALAQLQSQKRSKAWACTRTMRFIWGPEFLGVAATLHERNRRPDFVINMDMVGDNQAKHENAFVVERSPDYLYSRIDPMAEAVVDEVFRQTSRQIGRWESAAFHGFSDHALFADPSVATPAVQFCHPRDRHNHSSGDTVSNISEVEMCRSTAVAATLGFILAQPKSLSPDIENEVVRRWCALEKNNAKLVANRFRSIQDGRWSADLLRYVEARNRVLMATSPTTSSRAFHQGPDGTGIALARNWSGPFNTREMLQEAAEENRAFVIRKTNEDKRNYSLLINFANRIDGKKTKEQVIGETSLAFRRPICSSLSSGLFDALFSSGWVTERR